MSRTAEEINSMGDEHHLMRDALLKWYDEVSKGFTTSESNSFDKQYRIATNFRNITDLQHAYEAMIHLGLVAQKLKESEGTNDN